MNDLRSPLSFHPSTMQDHLLMEISLVVKIGMNDCENEKDKETFKKVLYERIKSTGIEIERFDTMTIKKDPYCGSLREKLIYDHSCREKPDADS